MTTIVQSSTDARRWAEHVERVKNVVSQCTCAPDDQRSRMYDLMASGMEQWAASVAAYGGDPAPTDPALIAGWVRRQFEARWPWLRLESGEVGPGAIWCGCVALMVFVVALAVVFR